MARSRVYMHKQLSYVVSREDYMIHYSFIYGRATYSFSFQSVKKWNMLPLVGAERNKEKCLQQFQRLVELRETSQIMADTSLHLLKRTVPDLKLILTAWRHRLPNTNEPVR